MKKILISYPLDDRRKSQLKTAAKNAHCIFADEDEITPELVSSVSAVIGNVPPQYFREYPGLEWVQLTTSGADAYVKEGVLHENTVLTCASGAYGLGIAEYMIAVLLAMMKKLPLYIKNQSLGRWNDEGGVLSPWGKRVLIVGTGDIGIQFAKRLRPFGCEIIGIRRREGGCPPEFDEMHTSDKLEDEIQKSDIIALCMPKTPETHHIINEKILKRCKKGAFLMNVGRGDAIDTEALLKPEIYENFGGIWLDVCETEPLPDGDPLFYVPNMIITPHITGGFHLDITINNVFDICMSNLKAWINEEALCCRVDMKSGYKK